MVLSSCSLEANGFHVVLTKETRTIPISDSKLQREEILANRVRQKKHLEALLIESRQKLADHSSGKKTLDNDDLKSLESKIDAFKRKLDTMEVRVVGIRGTIHTGRYSVVLLLIFRMVFFVIVGGYG